MAGVRAGNLHIGIWSSLCNCFSGCTLVNRYGHVTACARAAKFLQA